METMVLQGGGPALREDNSTAAAAAAAGVVKVSTAISNERSSMETSSRSSPSNPKNAPVTLNQEEQLEHTKSEMGEVREENERLKMILSQIVKDYQFLQKKYHDFIHQDPHQASKNPCDLGFVASGHDAENNNNGLEEEGGGEEEEEEPEELVSLTLGTSSSSSSLGQKKAEEINTTIVKGSSSERERGVGGDDLTLGLDLKLEGFKKSPDNNETESPENSFEEAKESDELGERWPPGKIPKNPSAGGDEASQQPQVKKARVSVRARCDSQTMNDGCQWRKYGQKIAKGNPCPRAYYRCTVAPGCPVRKQVQRCAEDMSILITTYEGTHNHPLPLSATAIASTTAAAASMLMSGSSASSFSSPPQPPVGLLSAANTTLNGLHLGLFGAGAGGGSGSMRPRQPFLPIPSISSTPTFPTITLDLTSQPPSSSASQFARSFPRYSSASFNFSSPTSEIAGATSPATLSWNSGFLSYGYGKSTGVGSLNLGGVNGGGRPSQDLYPYMLQKAAESTTAAAGSTTTPITDTIAKAITADPGFQSAVAAAITSYVGGAGQGHGLNLKPPGEPFSAASTAASGCGPSYLNWSIGSSGSSHQPSRLFFQPSPALPGSKSGSADQNGESIN